MRDISWDTFYAGIFWHKRYFNFVGMNVNGMKLYVLWPCEMN